MRAIKRSIAEASRDRATDDGHDDESPTCEHVTREHATRIALSRPMSPPRPFVPRDIAPMRCEPCPRVMPSRSLFDGSTLRHFQCDGRCVRDAQRAEQRARAHAELHRVRTLDARRTRMQIAITAILAVVAAMWIVLAAHEAAADARTRDHVRVAERDDDDGEDDDEHARPALDAPFAPPGLGAAGPPVRDVLAAAYRTAGLDHDLGRGFARRSRLAGLVPWLSVRTGRDTSWRDDQPDIARGVTIEVRATWRLDRLIFDGRELQVAALDAARRRERRRLAARVIQVYFVWKRAAGASTRSAVAEEAAAELDDLTDGWFSEARGLSDSRTAGNPD